MTNLNQDLTVTASFLYHYARLIEILTCLERIQAMINSPDLLSNHLRADAGINRLHGVGASEAPRGTLFHDYQVDERGLIQKINLIIATAHLVIPRGTLSSIFKQAGWK